MKPIADSWSRVTDHPGIEAIDAIRGKITPNQMNAAIPQRRLVTEEISGLIERVAFHNDESGVWILRKNGCELGHSLKLLFDQFG